MREAIGGDRGAALLVVLWLLLILAGIAAGVAYATRTQAQLAANRQAAAEARGLADAGVALGAAWLGEAGFDAEAAGGSFGSPCRLLTGAVSVSAIPLNALVDLNSADLDALTALFERAGAADPLAVANAVLDWRDPDNRPRFGGGAEAADYARAGVSFPPGNRPFDTVEELAGVLGLTPEVFAVARGLATAMDPEDDALGGERLAQPDFDFAESAALGLGGRPSAMGMSFLAGDAFRVTSLGISARGAAYSRQAVITADLDGPALYRVHQWRVGPRLDRATVATLRTQTRAAPPC